jgi:hypothetical protein
MKKIEIVIDPQGKATVQTKGFIGTACREASRFLEQALGRRVAELLTGEFYEMQEVEQVNRQQI